MGEGTIISQQRLFLLSFRRLFSSIVKVFQLFSDGEHYASNGRLDQQRGKVYTKQCTKSCIDLTSLDSTDVGKLLLIHSAPNCKRAFIFSPAYQVGWGMKHGM